MGRKPDLIVSKYFTRGAKIEDGSNRYQHTCKQCGERFPRGRSETMYSHITKKCTALSSQQRRHLVLQIHDSDLAVDDGANAAAKELAVKNGKTASAVLPPPQQNTNSLDVLAEASQQHSYPPPYAGPYLPSYRSSFSPSDTTTQNSIVLDPALSGETFTTNFFHLGENNDTSQDPGESAGGSPITPERIAVGSSWSGLVGSAAVPSMPKSLQRLLGDASLNAVSHSSDTAFQSNTVSSRSDGLRSIAASVAVSLTQATNPKASKTSYENGGLSSAAGVAATHTRQDILSTNPYARVIYMNSRTTVRDMASKSPQESLDQKAKVRAPFTAARKEEVKKMRQIGSCIRCRMLRKPCSATTPCVTCSAIDSPRTWKGFHCLRAKLVEMYQGYMLGLYQTISGRAMDAVRTNTRFTQGPCILVVRYLPDMDPIQLTGLITFVDRVSLDHPLSMGQDGQASAIKTVILDDEANDLPAILEGYIQQEAAQFFEQEESPIIKSAAELVHRYGQESGDTLSKTVVDLWMLTTMISDPAKVWSVSVVGDQPECSSDFLSSTAAVDTPVNEPIDQHSLALINLQLKAGLERLATKISTHAMNDFEKRMLRPVLSHRFEMLVTAFLLIHCVERHSWVFRSWTDQLRNTEGWPLNGPPASPAPQVEQLTAVIALMINIRHLTCRFTEPAAAGPSQAEQEDSPEGKYASWLGEIGVTVDQLVGRQDLAVFDGGDCRSLDLKYSATLLLPPSHGSVVASRCLNTT